MALSVHALTTVAQMESALGIGEGKKTTILERMIEAASASIEQYVEYHLEYNAAIVEKTEGYGDPFLYVKRRPILSITSILQLDVEGNTVFTWDSTDYRIEDDGMGAIYNPALWPSTSLTDSGLVDGSLVPGHEGKSIQVTYAGGWVTAQQVIDDNTLTRTLPWDIEQACIESIIALYNREKRDPDLVSKSTEQVTTTWARAGGSAASRKLGLLTPSAAGTMDAYKRTRF